jgi:hypothetical protein
MTNARRRPDAVVSAVRQLRLNVGEITDEVQRECGRWEVAACRLLTEASWPEIAFAVGLKSHSAAHHRYQRWLAEVPAWGRTGGIDIICRRVESEWRNPT